MIINEQMSLTLAHGMLLSFGSGKDALAKLVLVQLVDANLDVLYLLLFDVVKVGTGATDATGSTDAGPDLLRLQRHAKALEDAIPFGSDSGEAVLKRISDAAAAVAAVGAAAVVVGAVCGPKGALGCVSYSAAATAALALDGKIGQMQTVRGITRTCELAAALPKHDGISAGLHIIDFQMS